MNEFTKLEHVRINSDIDAAYYNNLGVDKCESGDLDEGIANFSKAIQFEPKLAVLYLNRSIALAKLGLISSAKVDFETIEVLQQEQHILEVFGRFCPELLETVKQALSPLEQ